MNYNLTKKEIRTVQTELLNFRYCGLIEKGETKPVKKITLADAREILNIEDELRRRLIKEVGHDFYPPDRIEEKHPSSYMISILKSRQDKPEEKVEPQFSFKITITSSIGAIVKKFNVKVDSKSNADIEAIKMIEKLGLKKATYKIS